MCEKPTNTQIIGIDDGETYQVNGIGPINIKSQKKILHLGKDITMHI